MMFAFRRLAWTCVVPTTIVCGFSSSTQAQIVQGAPQSTALRMVEVRQADDPPRLIPQGTTPRPIRTVAPRRPLNAPGNVARSPVNGSLNASAGIRQVSNQATQPRTGGGETDVQRQLRLLYEKSGQEMPVMDLNEMEVPEPQPGVMPEGGLLPPQQTGAGQPGGVPPTGGQPNYAQPPQDASKKPSFFERVFLGKKAPTATPQNPTPQRPPVPAPGAGRPAGGMPGNYPNTVPRPGQSAAPSYRPYTPNPPATQNALPQRPGMYQPGTGGQPGSIGAPQQRPVGNPGNAIATPVQPSAQAVPAQGQGEPGQTPQQGTETRRPSIPVLEDEPEESLEIDLTPRTPGEPQVRVPQQAKQQSAAPTLRRSDASRVVPAPLPVAAQPEPPVTRNSEATATPISTPEEQNPFSGLKLNLPETGSARPEAAAANQTINLPIVTPNPGVNTVKTTSVSPVKPGGSATPAIQPISPKASKTIPAIPVSRQSAPEESANPFLEPSATTATTTVDWMDENLKKLAAAPEKTGMKGFCPVMLRQHRTLALAKPQFNCSYQGRKFRFSSAEAKAQFEKSPRIFAPTYGGLDGVALLDDKKKVEGSLDHGAWYQGRLYLFSNRVNLELFNAEPEQYVDDEEDLDTPAAKVVSNQAAAGTAANGRAPASQGKITNSRGNTPSVGTNPRGPGTVPPASPAADELPVLGDDFGAMEPINPQENKSVGVPSPSSELPDANLNGLKLTVPASPVAPKSATPAPVQSPAENPGKASPPAVNPNGPTLEGPKLMGPKVSALAAPIKPASGTKPQESNPAPRLIRPPSKSSNSQRK